MTTAAPIHDTSCTRLNGECIGLHCPDCGKPCGPMGHNYTSRVKIVSQFGGSWEGKVRLDGCTIKAKLEPAFRYFNRVFDADATRLAAIGYRLPSLTAGDRIEIDGSAYSVDGVGFSRIED